VPAVPIHEERHLPGGSTGVHLGGSSEAGCEMGTTWGVASWLINGQTVVISPIGLATAPRILAIDQRMKWNGTPNPSDNLTLT
jgi:hypothetical protein